MWEFRCQYVLVEIKKKWWLEKSNLDLEGGWNGDNRKKGDPWEQMYAHVGRSIAMRRLFNRIIPPIHHKKMPRFAPLSGFILNFEKKKEIKWWRHTLFITVERVHQAQEARSQFRSNSKGVYSIVVWSSITLTQPMRKVGGEMSQKKGVIKSDKGDTQAPWWPASNFCSLHTQDDHTEVCYPHIVQYAARGSFLLSDM